MSNYNGIVGTHEELDTPLWNKVLAIIQTKLPDPPIPSPTTVPATPFPSPTYTPSSPFPSPTLAPSSPFPSPTTAPTSPFGASPDYGPPCSHVPASVYQVPASIDYTAPYYPVPTSVECNATYTPVQQYAPTAPTSHSHPPALPTYQSYGTLGSVNFSSGKFF